MAAVRRFDLSPGRIAAGYLAFGLVWIASTDRLVLAVAESPAAVARLQTAKGWAFVGLSTLLILGLSWMHRRQMEGITAALERTSQHLHVLHRVFRHNIRNDLNVILGYVANVDEALGSERDDVRTQLRTVRRTADDIVSIGEKFRIVESVDPTGTDLETVELVDLVGGELDRVGERHPTATIETDLPDRAAVVGDHALGYAIREVLENAVEHHPEPARCWIGVTIKRSGGELRLTIEDDGAGIPEHELQAVRRGDESQLGHASSVGLWLVTWICGIHGVDVTFARVEDGGTAVTFAFRAANDAPVVALAPPAITG